MTDAEANRQETVQTREPVALTRTQRFLLEWLAKDDGPYGECRGRDLDVLRDHGFARWDVGAGRPTDDYCRVSITDAGVAWLRQSGGSL